MNGVILLQSIAVSTVPVLQHDLSETLKPEIFHQITNMLSFSLLKCYDCIVSVRNLSHKPRDITNDLTSDMSVIN